MENGRDRDIWQMEKMESKSSPACTSSARSYNGPHTDYPRPGDKLFVEAGVGARGVAFW